jgi:hypothetical protein
LYGIYYVISTVAVTAISSRTRTGIVTSESPAQEEYRFGKKFRQLFRQCPDSAEYRENFLSTIYAREGG